MENDINRSTPNGETLDPPLEFGIRRLVLEDLASLKPVLEQSIVNAETKEPITDDIIQVLEDIKGSIEGTNNKQYLVAHDSDNVAFGIMGIDIPNDQLKTFASTENPLELINAYIDPRFRGAGVGLELTSGLEDIARSEGASELLVNSGPRYQKTGWGFWTSIYGEPIGSMENYYGPGFDAPVWKKDLTISES